MLRDATPVLVEVNSLLSEHYRYDKCLDPYHYLVGALEAHYNQTFRSYHNLDHIHNMVMDWLKSGTHGVADPAELVIAMLFHDTVYSLRAKSPENERESADVALTIGPKVFKNIDWQRVHRLIMATTHTGGLVERDEQIMADYDLRSLAAPNGMYWATRENVVKEYLTMYTEEEVRQGRLAFLNAMLSREKIFYLPGSDEDQARSNLTSELTWLAGNNPVLRS